MQANSPAACSNGQVWLSAALLKEISSASTAAARAEAAACDP